MLKSGLNSGERRSRKHGWRARRGVYWKSTLERRARPLPSKNEIFA